MILKNYLTFIFVLFLTGCTYKSENPDGVAKIDIEDNNRIVLVQCAMQFAKLKGYDFFDATKDYKVSGQVTLIELKKNGITKVIISDMRDKKRFLIAFFNVPSKPKWEDELYTFETILKQHNVRKLSVCESLNSTLNCDIPLRAE